MRPEERRLVRGMCEVERFFHLHLWVVLDMSRDMKEKMAGPGDKYAKDTRKYNPDFAAEHPEDEYDNKIEEVNHTLNNSMGV